MLAVLVKEVKKEEEAIKWSKKESEDVRIAKEVSKDNVIHNKPQVFNEKVNKSIDILLIVRWIKNRKGKEECIVGRK